ncbi:dapper homolog 1-like [Haplochromis burtoni]|uniref:dapper homolog 1-like n=1 Tax=Haplochromis burtoni TaxID=8153 RepID=UPI001C2DA851|nr:dapper homolog 1-like [Haplochromis burtoni]
MLPSGTSRRDKAAVRERLEASVSGLGELELLRRRQEVLVRAALELREPREEEERQRREAQLSSEEKLLEGNILLLRKQLVKISENTELIDRSVTAETRRRNLTVGVQQTEMR